MYGSSLFSTLVVYNKYWSRKNRLAPRELNSRPDFFEQPYQFSQLRGLHVPHDLPMEDLNGAHEGRAVARIGRVARRSPGGNLARGEPTGFSGSSICCKRLTLRTVRIHT